MDSSNNHTYFNSACLHHYFYMPYYGFRPVVLAPLQNYVQTVFSHQQSAKSAFEDTLSISERQDKQKINDSSILQRKQQRYSKTNKKAKIVKNMKKCKQYKQVNQKEGRNVISNLLRVFLKNLLELHSFDIPINSIIKKHKIKQSKEQFYSWVISFGINIKNYIKLKQIKNIVSSKESENFKIIFRTMLYRFCTAEGYSHCFTSRRIESSAIKIHIKGLRQIKSIYFNKQKCQEEQ